jgi:hypothetical protein
VIEKLSHRLSGWFVRADARTRGTLGVLGAAAKRLGLVRAPEAAASLAYYAIFTLFPLVLLLAAFGTLFLRSDVVYEAVAGELQVLFVVGRAGRRRPAGRCWRTSVGLFGPLCGKRRASPLVQHITAFRRRPSGTIDIACALLIVLQVLLLFMAS